MAALALSSDLLDPVLGYAIRQLATLPSVPHHDLGHTFSSVLHVLPRDLVPDVTKSALFEMPWIDMTFASKIGDTLLLDFMLKWSNQRGGRPAQYSHEALTLASQFGHIHVLNWWWNQLQSDSTQSLFVYWTPEAVDRACENGHVDVLDWWWQQCEAMGKAASFKYSHRAMDRASAQGHLHVLDWWMAHSHDIPELKYSEQALRGAASNDHLQALDWWAQHGVQGQIGLPSFAGVLRDAAESGNIQILEWLAQQSVPSVLDWNAIDTATAFWEPALVKAQLAAIHWWESNAHLFPFPSECESRRIGHWAAQSANATVLDWVSHQLQSVPLRGFEKELMLAVISSPTVGRDDDATPTVQALEWIHKNCMSDRPVTPEPPLSGSLHASTPTPSELISTAIQHGRGTRVLDWFVSHFSPWHPSDDDVRAATLRGSEATLDWLIERACFKLADDKLPRYAGWAVASGHLPVIQWWHQRGCRIRNQQLLLLAQKAAAEGKCDLFAWCLSHDGGRAARSIAQLHPIVDIASYCGQVDVMDCWRDWCTQRGIHGQYTIAAVDEASAFGKVESLDWWLRSSVSHDLPLLFTDNAVTVERSPLTADKVLSWWIRSGLLNQFRGTIVPVMAELPSHGCITWMHRLRKAGLVFSASASLIADASAGGHVCVLNYLATLGESVVPSSLWSDAVDNAIMGAISKHQGHVLDWWKRQDHVKSLKSGHVLHDLLNLIAT